METEESLPFNLKQLVLAFQKKSPLEDYPKDLAKIRVNNTISRMAFFYERFRNAIDYKDEHLLRKNAIERILKRRLVAGTKIQKVAYHLIYELIRARYLPNNAIPEIKINDIAATINNFVLLFHEIVHNFKGQEYYYYRKWVIGIAAVELERQLSDAYKDEALVDFAFRTISENLEWRDDSISPKDKNILLYIAIHRALIKSDPAMLSHHLWNFQFGEWKNVSKETIYEAGRTIASFKKEVDDHLNHRLNDYLLNKIKKTSILFQILKDVIEENPREATDILTDQEILDKKIRGATRTRYQKAHIKLERSVKRSLIYLFFTKTVLAFLIEIPYDYYFIKQINYRPLIVNILFHPLFLFFLAVIINVPGNKNTERIIRGVHGILATRPEARPKWRIRPLKRRVFVNFVFQVVYGLAFILSFGFLISVLTFLKFNAISTFLFIFFFTVVSFLGIKLRQDTKELRMQTRREGWFSILIDFFTVPIIRVGHWLSLRAPKVNLFVFILDVIIEAPFKSFVEVSEEWVEYIKEKKDEIY